MMHSRARVPTWGSYFNETIEVLDLGLKTNGIFPLTLLDY